MKCVHPVTSGYQGRPGHTLYIRVVLGTCGGVASLEVLGLSGHCRLLDYIRSYTSSSSSKTINQSLIHSKVEGFKVVLMAKAYIRFTFSTEHYSMISFSFGPMRDKALRSLVSWFQFSNTSFSTLCTTLFLQW